jgi:hypothetical protein
MIGIAPWSAALDQLGLAYDNAMADFVYAV